ncbi:MAG: hypothetical protein M3Y56_05335, partial [Armatimonadota bacterium]|nr:hypothetical protein [Armatimonadota bacterium]
MPGLQASQPEPDHFYSGTGDLDSLGRGGRPADHQHPPDHYSGVLLPLRGAACAGNQLLFHLSYGAWWNNAAATARTTRSQVKTTNDFSHTSGAAYNLGGWLLLLDNDSPILAATGKE